jgi:hypothetical protein
MTNIGSGETPAVGTSASLRSTSAHIAGDDRNALGDMQRASGDAPGHATAAPAAPMQTKIVQEKRMRAILLHVEKTGFLLHNEIRYVWFLYQQRVRPAGSAPLWPLCPTRIHELCLLYLES